MTKKARRQKFSNSVQPLSLSSSLAHQENTCNKPPRDIYNNGSHFHRDEDSLKYYFIAKNGKGRKIKYFRFAFLNTVGCIGILAGFIYQCVTFLNIFFLYPTTIEFNLANEVSLDFPAITVCNSNPIRYKLWCQENRDICIRKVNETLEEIRERHAEEYNKLSRDKRIELGNQFKDFVLHAEYEEEVITEPFDEYYDYEFTNCFTFNARWGDENRKVRSAFLFNPITGKSSELVMCVNMDIDNYSNLTEPASGRVKMTIHANDIVPNPTYDSASLEAGRFYSYGIQKVTTELLERPYQTKCRSYDKEREFRTGAKMSQKNCLLECFKTESEQKCGCTYRRLALMYGANPCEFRSQRHCLEVVENEVFNACNPKCPMACRKVNFENVATDAEPLRKESSLYDRMNIDNIFKSREEMK